MYNRKDISNKLSPNTLHWLEQLAIFTYKVLAWAFLGLVIGSFFASLQGFLPLWFMIVHIVGSIATGWVFVIIFIRYIDHKASLSLVDGRENKSTHIAPARIDAVAHGGIRLLESRSLMIIQTTVFPRFQEPYCTTIRQYMRQDEIYKLQEGTTVSFCEKVRDPGYGTISLQLPHEEIREDYQTIVAEKVYPERQKTGLWILIGQKPTVFTRSVSYLLIIVVFTISYLLPYIVTGNVEWLVLRIKHFPQKLIFQNKGNFNPEEFKKSYEKANTQIGENAIESLLFYKEFTTNQIEEPHNIGYLRRLTIRGNSVEENFSSMRIDDRDRMFTSKSISYAVLKKVLESLATDHKIEDIIYIGFRKDIRWGSRKLNISPDYSRTYVDIHIVFNGGNKSLDYDGKTGERLPD